MGRIKDNELYPQDQNIAADDMLIGSDGQQSGRTKNFTVGALQTFLFDGNNAGSVSITSVIQDTNLTDIDTVSEYINQVSPAIVLGNSEILVVEFLTQDSNEIVSHNRYLFKFNNGTYGFEALQTTDDDFILLERIVKYDTDIRITADNFSNISGVVKNNTINTFFEAINTFIGTLGTVATSNDYNDLDNLPTIGSVPTETSELTNNGADGTSTYVENDEIGATATSNDYNDLDNRPDALSDFTDDVTVQSNFTEENTAEKSHIQNRNPQREVDVSGGSYTIQNSDNLHVLFLNNAAANATITVPNTLPDNFWVGFIQTGTGNITFAAGAGATLNFPSGLGLRIQGQNHQASVEKRNTGGALYLLGNVTT